MDLEYLRSFIAVVDSGSLLRGSKRIGVSRGTLKNRIEQLEQHAGTPLLNRGPKGIEPTEAGFILFEHAKRLVADADRMFSKMGASGDSPEGLLEVIVPIGVEPALMARLAEALMSSYPKLELVVDSSDDPLRFSRDKGDMLVYFGSQLPRGAWVTKTLHRLELRVMGSPMYLAQHGTPTSVEELLEHELMAWDYPCDDPCRWSLLGGGDVVVEPRFQTTDLYGLWLCLGGGQGLGLAPVTEHVALGEARMPLVPVLEDVVGMSLDLRLAWAESIDRQPWLRPVLATIDALIEDVVGS